MWRSLVARFVRDEEAVGSNPATPTDVVAGHSSHPPSRLTALFGSSPRLVRSAFESEGGFESGPSGMVESR